MLILKRLAVWFLETLAEAFLLGPVLAVRLGFDRHAFVRDSLIFSVDVAVFFFTTGYLVTTLITRALWRGERIARWYPVIASVLFLIHFEIMNRSWGWVFAPADLRVIFAAGICIALACTVAGTFVLGKWDVGEQAIMKPVVVPGA